jgi:hypothetical protein
MDDAIIVLQAAVNRAGRGKQLRAGVRLALKALRFVGVPAEAICYFCDACGSENEIGSAQDVAPRSSASN